MARDERSVPPAHGAERAGAVDQRAAKNALIGVEDGQGALQKGQWGLPLGA